MAASATDLLQKVSIATATTLDAPGYTIGDTSITVASTSTWPTDTGITFAIDEVDADGNRVANSYNEYVGIVSSGTSVTSVSHVNGTNRDFTAGATTRVYIPVSEERENRIVTWGLTHADQDGTLKAGSVDGAAVLASNVVTNAKILDSTIELNAKAAPWDCWTAGSSTWTYASATTFTVPAADAAAMTVGTKIKLTQTTVKYFYVTGVSGTTLTVTGGTDYTLANAAITAPYFSNAATPQGFPQWFAYTPTPTAFTIGTGGSAEASGQFKIEGTDCIARVRLVLGTSGQSVSNNAYVTTPLTIKSSYYAAEEVLGMISLLDGASGYQGSASYKDTTTVYLRSPGSSGGGILHGGTTSTTPFTWAAGDSVAGVYRFRIA